jgi:energy-converting hydrogenase Eha subunit F
VWILRENVFQIVDHKMNSVGCKCCSDRCGEVVEEAYSGEGLDIVLEQVFIFNFLVVLGFSHRASHLLSRRSAT